ncbi:MAG: signal peptidase II [Pseudomonadales bacterium]
MMDPSSQTATLAQRARTWPWLLLAALVVCADQLSKAVVVRNLDLHERIDVLPIFAWVRWHNEGAAFSMFNDAGGWQRWVFVGLAIGFVGFLLYELRRLPTTQKIMGWVYALIMGGAIGNGIDRALNGYVVDFVLVHYQTYYFPAFNVADAALSCGAVLWIFVMIMEHRQERALEQADRQ